VSGAPLIVTAPFPDDMATLLRYMGCDDAMAAPSE
jgi:hypothetical protein